MSDDRKQLDVTMLRTKDFEKVYAEVERLRARLRVIRRTVESERGRNLDTDRVVDRVAAWVDEALREEATDE